VTSPKIRRPPRHRSAELAAYLVQCGVPETPDVEVRKVLEDATTTTRRALAALMRKAGLLDALTPKRQDDLARLVLACPSKVVTEARAIVNGKPPTLRPRMARLLAEALLARNACADAHARLAITYALGVDPRGEVVSRLTASDLVQECMLAILHTAEVYDRTRGSTGHSSFANCAAWWLRHHAERALREQGHDIKPPGSALSSRTRIVRAVDAFESAFGRSPTAEEIADLVEKPVRLCAQVIEWMKGGFVFTSADRTFSTIDSGVAGVSRWVDLQPAPAPDPSDARGRGEADAVGLALETLEVRSAPAAEVVRLVHGIGGDPVKVTEIARRTGRTRGQVEALLAEGEQALRVALADLVAAA
jgi:RNA polymerase sigma factor (sigma-70 family)